MEGLRLTVEEILNGESREVEYKEIVPENSKKYTKTAVAYANCSGGLLIFGVENNTWKVLGIPQERVFEVADGISNAIIDSCEPMIDFDIKYQNIEGKTIIIVQVYPGKGRPYFLKSEGKSGGVYVRVHGSTRVADEFIVKELEFQGSNRSYDQIPVVGETVTDEEIDNLCNTMYEYALSQCANKQEEKNVKRITKKNLLAWGLLQTQEGKVVPTNGYMLLTRNDKPEASVQCGVFKGTTRAVFLDRKEYSGPIYEQIDEAYNFVLRNIRMGAEFGGLLRRDVYELPVDSIRELIANAVIHRSYLVPARVQVALYDDRLEVTYPGMLIGGFTIKDLKAGCCLARNRGIVNALTYMKIIEQWGSGIPRLLENCKNAGLKEPELLEIGGNFRVNMFRNTELIQVKSECIQNNENSGEKKQGETKEKLRRKTKEKKQGETKEKIIKLMKDNPVITYKEIMEELSLSRSGVEYAVRKLRETGRVERIGADKGGSWKVHG